MLEVSGVKESGDRYLPSRKVGMKGLPQPRTYIVWIAFLFILNFVSGARTLCQIREDTTKTSTPPGKSSTGAVLRSAAVPGWGQWYNGQKLKAVLVLGGSLGLIGNAIYNNQLAVKSSTYDEREFYRSNRSRAVWLFVVVYLLNLLDAYVDAQLWNFDTGPDLSMCGELRGGQEVLVTLYWGF